MLRKFLFISIFIIVIYTLLTHINILSHNSSSFAAAAGDVKAGEKLYKRKCAICHGDQGQGATALKLKDQAVLSKSDEELRKFINDGGNGMPAYGKTLKPEEIDALVFFLRSWAK